MHLIEAHDVARGHAQDRLAVGVGQGLGGGEGGALGRPGGGLLVVARVGGLDLRIGLVGHDVEQVARAARQADARRHLRVARQDRGQEHASQAVPGDDHRVPRGLAARQHLEGRVEVVEHLGLQGPGPGVGAGILVVALVVAQRADAGLRQSVGDVAHGLVGADGLVHVVGAGSGHEHDDDPPVLHVRLGRHEGAVELVRADGDRVVDAVRAGGLGRRRGPGRPRGVGRRRGGGDVVGAGVAQVEAADPAVRGEAELHGHAAAGVPGDHGGDAVALGAVDRGARDRFEGALGVHGRVPGLGELLLGQGGAHGVVEGADHRREISLLHVVDQSGALLLELLG